MNRKIVLVGAIIVIISVLLLVLYIPITTLSASQLSEQFNKSSGTYAYSEGTIQRISGTIESLRYIPLFNITLVIFNGGTGAQILVFGNATKVLKTGNDIVAVATLMALQFSLRSYLYLITNTSFHYAWFSSVHNIIFSNSYDLFFSVFIAVGVVIALIGIFRSRQK